MFMNNKSYIIRTKLANQTKMQDIEQNRACKDKFCSQGVTAYDQWIPVEDESQILDYI